MKMHPMAALALSALMATCVVQAAEPLGVQAELTVWQVPTTAKGQAVAKAEQAKPGDVLSYQVRYQNTGTQVARKVVATLPIPATGLVFMSGTALPEGATASTDGRNFDALPLKRWVVLPGGQREQRLVPVREYRALRWDLGELQPGQERKVSARMRVDDAASTTTTPGSTQ